MKLFNPESPLMQLLSKIGYLMALSLLYCISCVPIVTIGAATSAFYTILFQDEKHTDSDSLLVRFFSAFKSNFKKATLLWIILLIIAAIIGYNFYFISANPDLAPSFIPVILWVVSGYFLLACMYVFPLQARFENKVFSTLRNAFVFAVARLPISILLLAIFAIPFVILYFSEPLSMIYIVFMIFFGIALWGRLRAKLLLWAFKKAEKQSV